MDPETEMNLLLEEETYLSELITKLRALKKRKGYSNCLEDIVDLINKLKDKRKNIKAQINDITNSIIAAAEAFEGIDIAADNDFSWEMIG